MRILESALLTLKSIQDVFEPLCEAKGVTFAIQAQPAIWIDKVRFYQIFHNILSNAGVNAHLSKPVNIVQIERTLSAEVARARHFRQTKDWK